MGARRSACRFAKHEAGLGPALWSLLSLALVSHDTPFPWIRSWALHWVLAFPCSIAWRCTALGRETKGRRLSSCTPPCKQSEGIDAVVPLGHADLAVVGLVVLLPRVSSLTGSIKSTASSLRRRTYACHAGLRVESALASGLGLTADGAW
jgi:hypothetical protein